MKSPENSHIRYLSKNVQNFELCRRRGFKEFDTEAASKLRLPKQHPPTDKDRGARYRSVKEKLKNESLTKMNKIATINKLP